MCAMVCAGAVHGGYRILAPGSPSRVSSCTLEVDAPWRSICALGADATQLTDPSWEPLLEGKGICAQSLWKQAGATASEPQAAGCSEPASASTPWKQRLVAALAAAKEGCILPLQVATIDVLAAPRDGTRRTPCVSADDPIIAIVSELHGHLRLDTAVAAANAATTAGTAAPPTAAAAAGAPQAPGQHASMMPDASGTAADMPASMAAEAGRGTVSGGEMSDAISDESSEEEEAGLRMSRLGKRARPRGAGSTRRTLFPDGGNTGMEESADASAQGHTAASSEWKFLSGAECPIKVAFVLIDAGRASQATPWQPFQVQGAQVVPCATEEELLGRWQHWVHCSDPDVLATFQLRDTLGALSARAEAIKFPRVFPASETSPGSRSGAAGGTGLHLSRLLPHRSAALSTKSVVMYSPSWVKSQVRFCDCMRGRCR